MVIVTGENFATVYPDLEKILGDAAFIAIDAEYSGLRCENVANESLFDSPRERYKKLTGNIRPFIMIQFGLTAFVRSQNENSYIAHSFTFYLMPKALPTNNRNFLVQASSFQFLATYNFDFNKLAYSSISYLNENEEAMMSECLKNDTLVDQSPDFVTNEYRIEVSECLERVQQWLKSKETEETLSLSASTAVACYLMQKELRLNFKEIWTDWTEATTFSVTKVTPSVRVDLEQNHQYNLNEKLMDHFMGFSKIYKLMVKLKKPIVGHNLLLDLMFMYKQFFKPLPDKYESFKKDIHSLFPIVYDTKFLSYQMKKTLNKVTWKSNVLASLYDYYNNGPGRYLALNSPRIVPPGASSDSNQLKIHDAAWDSYYTGFCFIRMAHVCAVQKLGQSADIRELTNTEIMMFARDQANRVNLVRANVSHIRLDGADPESTRPQWLVIESRSGQLTMRPIVQSLSSLEDVDLMRLSSCKVLVAVPNHRTAREIMEKCEGKEFRVVPYDSLKHSTTGRFVCGWVGLAICVYTARWILYKIIR